MSEVTAPANPEETMLPSPNTSNHAASQQPNSPARPANGTEGNTVALVTKPQILPDAEKPDYPFQNSDPSSPDYPDLITLRLFFQKDLSKVPDDVWPWKRPAGKNITYFKHLGYGQPPASLPANSGDLFVDFTTPDFPLIYIYNNQWLDYGESYVLLNDRQAWMGIPEHPLFNDRYLWAHDKKGLIWSGQGAMNGHRLVCLNDDRPEAANWFTKYLVHAYEMLALGAPRDLVRIPDTEGNRKRREEELNRRRRVQPPEARPHANATPLAAASNTPSARPQRAASARIPVKKSRKPASRVSKVPRAKSGKSSRKRRRKVESDSSDETSSLTASSLSSPELSDFEEPAPPPPPPPTTAVRRRDPSETGFAIRPPSQPDLDSQDDIEMDVEPPPRFEATSGPYTMDIDPPAPQVLQGELSQNDLEDEEIVQKSVRRLLEARKKQREERHLALITIQSLRRAVQQAQDFQLRAEERAIECETRLESVLSESQGHSGGVPVVKKSDEAGVDNNAISLEEKAQLLSTLAVKEHDLTQKIQALADKEKELSEKDKELAKAKEALAHKTSELALRDSQVEDLRAQISRLKLEGKDKQEKMTAIHNIFAEDDDFDADWAQIYGVSKND
ncbi:hypothetical protein DL96DRAFT_1639323 [Flagelloscypha sp. PMI_526]|nr:hypothetical protein DL96DRAFT_1639323 [Flagelloscypha sp. PMI_526]